MKQDQSGERLQKVMAAAGVGSRRACEDLIARKRVSVNGEVVKVQGMRVDPQKDTIHVDGMKIVTATDMVYLALHKPRGIQSTMSDDQGRPCIGDLIEGRVERLFHVGRLDADSEGLILLTNDGELGHRLTHPSYGIRKTYLVEVDGQIARDVGKRLREGVELEDGLARVDDFKVIDAAQGRSLVELQIHEGRKHIVRRLMAEVGNPVQRLLRTAMGPVQLGSQKPGRTRPLNSKEIGQLHKAVGL